MKTGFLASVEMLTMKQKPISEDIIHQLTGRLTQIIHLATLFTESTHLASQRVAMSICLFVCDVSKHPLPEVVETSG